MKLIRNILSIALVLIMALSVTACHKKNELAVTVNDFEFTSAYYMCALINAYSEGQSEVINALGDKATSDVNYFKQNIAGKKFETWVKDRAIEILEEIGTYKKLCKDAKIELDDEMTANAEYMAYYYWYYYGYSEYFEPNGVSFNTYTQYTVDTYYTELYFTHIYGEGGEKEIASADVEAKLYKDFLIADLIDVSFTSSQTDKEKEEIKAKLDGYLKDLQDGKKTFEEVYNDYNKVEEEEKTEEEENHDHDGDGTNDHEDAETNTDTESTETETEEEKELEPLDKYAQVLGAKDTGYDHDHFETISKMATDEVKLITKDDKAGYILVVKKDIKADPYYRENFDSIVRHLLKDTEFNTAMAEEFKTAKTEIVKYAINQFKVKKIKEPSYY